MKQTHRHTRTVLIVLFAIGVVVVGQEASAQSATEVALEQVLPFASGDPLADVVASWAGPSGNTARRDTAHRDTAHRWNTAANDDHEPGEGISEREVIRLFETYRRVNVGIWSHGSKRYLVRVELTKPGAVALHADPDSKPLVKSIGPRSWRIEHREGTYDLTLKPATRGKKGGGGDDDGNEHFGTALGNAVGKTAAEASSNTARSSSLGRLLGAATGRYHSMMRVMGPRSWHRMFSDLGRHFRARFGKVNPKKGSITYSSDG